MNLEQICRTNTDRAKRESPIKKSDSPGQHSQPKRGSIKTADSDFQPAPGREVADLFPDTALPGGASAKLYYPMAGTPWRNLLACGQVNL